MPEFVDDFIRKIRKDTQFAFPKKVEITLHGSSGTAISVGDPISSLAPGNSFTNPLHVQVSDAAKPASNAELTSFWNSLRQMSADDGFLHLPLVTDLIEDDTSTIYIRESYKDLFNIIWNMYLRGAQSTTPSYCHNRNAGDWKEHVSILYSMEIGEYGKLGTVILRRQMDEGDIYGFKMNDVRWPRGVEIYGYS